MLFVGRNQLVGQIEFAAKIERERRLDQEAVGALFEERITVSDRKQRAAEAVAGFEELQFSVRQELPQSVRSSESGDAAADDGNPWRA